MMLSTGPALPMHSPRSAPYSREWRASSMLEPGAMSSSPFARRRLRSEGVPSTTSSQSGRGLSRARARGSDNSYCSQCSRDEASLPARSILRSVMDRGRPALAQDFEAHAKARSLAGVPAWSSGSRRSRGHLHDGVLPRHDPPGPGGRTRDRGARRRGQGADPRSGRLGCWLSVRSSHASGLR